MSQTKVQDTELFRRYVAACDYPGALDADAVESHLRRYLAALGIERRILRLNIGWELADHPSLARYVDRVLEDFAKRNPKTARAASAASAAGDALVALDARAALDARDASAALWTSIKHFASWCVQAGGWWYWRFDVSWISATHFGALQNKKPDVLKWTEPVLKAFIAGCWLLHFTDDTLYWVAKPRVHKETNRRLHNANGPALESDVENLYFWHGVLVPAFVIVKPEWITIKHIQTEDNAEVRRVMIERYGEDRYIVDSGMKPVAHDEVFGTLYVEPQEAGTPVAKIRVVNRSPEPDGSFKPYWLDVNPAHYGGDAGRVPQAAIASTWRTKDGALAFKDYRDYSPSFES